MIGPLLFGLGVLYVVLLLAVFVFQDKLIYQPSFLLVETPDQRDLSYESVYLNASEDVQLHGWWIPADDARGTLLFFHGNAGNISGRLDSIRQFHDLGLNVFIFDYRGYGKSSGTPSEEGLYEDARAVWQYLTETRGIDSERIVIFGRSLGSGPATWLADQHPPGALILESPFTSFPEVAAEHYPFFPTRLLVKAQFPNLERIQHMTVPLLVIHSRDDRVVPFIQGRHLYEAAPGPKSFLEIDGAHNDGFMVSADRYTRRIRTFLDRHLDHA